MEEDLSKPPTVGKLLDTLGYGHPGNDLDNTLRWALIELQLLRKKVKQGEIVSRVFAQNYLKLAFKKE